ncbi:COX aromatic rich motif-containing protein [Microbulbifer taiwanensis]
MNSFFIPALGGQIYAMAGMQTRLNLLADRSGCFRGRNMQYSGDGFPDQHFAARALSAEAFEDWVAKARKSPERLDATSYRALAAPSRDHPVSYYSGVAPRLFDSIIAKYAGQHPE